MITIIPPSQFKTIPWKNGLGETTELAINEGGNLDCFDWRLSIASVVNDGLFSDFSGYQRQLILIEGKGIKLEHHNQKIDKLDQHLKMADFDGGCKTVGKLISGSIKDFNVMTNRNTYTAIVNTFTQHQSVNINSNHSCFIYSVTNELLLINDDKGSAISKNHLVKINLENEGSSIKIQGENFIVIELIKLV